MSTSSRKPPKSEVVVSTTKIDPSILGEGEGPAGDVVTVSGLETGLQLHHSFLVGSREGVSDTSCGPTFAYYCCS